MQYTQIRQTFGKPICEHQAIQLKLGEMATRVQAARLLTYDAARAYDSGERCDMEAGMAKYFASEAAVENALEAMRIHGGYGYSKEYHVERYFRDAPLMCIGEGTNEIQRMIIAKQLIAAEPGMRPARGAGPLAGIRILAVEQYGAGPVRQPCIWPDIGAEVIKIEAPEDGSVPGDLAPVRSVFPRRERQPFLPDLQSRQGASHARPRSARGQARCCERLVASADAVAQQSARRPAGAHRASPMRRCRTSSRQSSAGTSRATGGSASAPPGRPTTT